jgi:hypothetical protein
MKTNLRKLALILRKVDASKFFYVSVTRYDILLGAIKQDVLIDDLNINWDSIEYDLEKTIFKKNNVKLIVS